MSKNRGLSTIKGHQLGGNTGHSKGFAKVSGPVIGLNGANILDVRIFFCLTSFSLSDASPTRPIPARSLFLNLWEYTWEEG